MNDDPLKKPPSDSSQSLEPLVDPTKIVSDVQEENLTDLPGVEKESEVSPKDKLKFAKQILFGLVILFIASFVMSALGFKEIFESCKEILPPIATLIIGYYFGAIK